MQRCHSTSTYKQCIESNQWKMFRIALISFRVWSWTLIKRCQKGNVSWYTVGLVHPDPLDINNTILLNQLDHRWQCSLRLSSQLTFSGLGNQISATTILNGFQQFENLSAEKCWIVLKSLQMFHKLLRGSQNSKLKEISTRKLASPRENSLDALKMATSKLCMSRRWKPQNR